MSEESSKLSAVSWISVLINFLGVVLAVGTSLLIVFNVVLDGRYADKDSTVAALATIDKYVVEVDSKVEKHVAQNTLVESQLRRDVARLEQNDLDHKTNIFAMREDLGEIKTSVAVIAEKLTRSQ